MPGARPADQALVRRCLANDQDACAELVDAYARMVGSIIWRATRYEPHVVEDLVQETFMRVFRGLPYFTARAKLSTWICTIAHRVAVDHIRSAARAHSQQSESIEEIENLAVPSPRVVTNPEEAAAQAELDALLRQEVQLLPDNYRIPLVYVAIEGVDYRTVSEMLEMPLGTVKANVFYAKQMLRERLRLRMRERSDS